MIMKKDIIIPEYQATINNIHIINSCIISKHDFKPILLEIEDDNPECLVFDFRSIHSLIMEWSCHNCLYNFGIEVERTKDVDLNWPIKWYIKLAYNIFGLIAWIFIR